MSGSRFSHPWQFFVPVPVLRIFASDGCSDATKSQCYYHSQRPRCFGFINTTLNIGARAVCFLFSSSAELSSQFNLVYCNIENGIKIFHLFSVFNPRICKTETGGELDWIQRPGGGECVQHICDHSQPVQTRAPVLGQLLPRLRPHQDRAAVLRGRLLSAHGHSVSR